MKTVLAAIGVTIALAAPALAQDAKSIAQQGNQKWVQAYNAGDAAALTPLYTKGAVLLPQGVAEPLIGETNIRKFCSEMLKQRLVNMSLPVTEAKLVSPDILFDVGTWTGDVPGENGGAATHLSGTYLSVWLREGSDWRLRADTWNMMPPPPPK